MMAQSMDRAEAVERYDEAQEWLAFLIDHPDKTVSVAAYRTQLKDAQATVNAAHKAVMARG